jgi:hypothetical protein
MTEQRKKTPGELMAEQKVKDDAERKRFYAERKALNERAAANFRAAENERQRVQAQDAQVAHEQALREALRQSYIQANGAEFGFAEAFPKLREEYVRAQTLQNLAPKPATTLDRAKKTLDLLYGKR